MKTLVWTRAEMFPLDQSENRLKYPNCGSRRIRIFFSVSDSPEAQRQPKNRDLKIRADLNRF
jgi:hypothetical protein